MALRTVLFLAAVAAACSPAYGPGTPMPSPSPQPAACATPTVARTAPAGARLASAALLSITVTVDSQRAAHPACVAAVPRQAVHLHLGDRVQLVANGPPHVAPDGVLAVTTARGPATTGPGGLATIHVIVTLTAVAPGTAGVTWIDCSGTGC